MLVLEWFVSMFLAPEAKHNVRHIFLRVGLLVSAGVRASSADLLQRPISYPSRGQTLVG